MPNDTPAAVCGCCGDGTPVGVVPWGNLKGTPACDDCLRALGEPDPLPADADSLDPLPVVTFASDEPVTKAEWDRKVSDWLGPRPAAWASR